jgi:hypothetical protein
MPLQVPHSLWVARAAPVPPSSAEIASTFGPGSPAGTVYPSHSISQFNSPAGGMLSPPSNSGQSQYTQQYSQAPSIARGSLLTSAQPQQTYAPSLDALALARAVAPTPLYSSSSAAASAYADRPLASSASGSALPPLGTPEEYGQLFAAHEEWFKQATAKRQEVRLLHVVRCLCKTARVCRQTAPSRLRRWTLFVQWRKQNRARLASWTGCRR